MPQIMPRVALLDRVPLLLNGSTNFYETHIGYLDKIIVVVFSRVQ